MILETRDRIPRRAPGAWSLLLPLPVSLPLSLSVTIIKLKKKKEGKLIGYVTVTFSVAFGSNVTPQPSLQSRAVAYKDSLESSPAFWAPCAGQTQLPTRPDDAQQQAALLAARDTLPASLPPATMYDLPRAQGSHPHTYCSALNAGRIIVELGHPNHEQLRQDQVHRRHPAAKEGLLLC